MELSRLKLSHSLRLIFCYYCFFAGTWHFSCEKLPDAVCSHRPHKPHSSPLSAIFLQLIKTHNLLPSRNYIFGYHPHGIFCFGAFCNFGTEATGFSKKFPGIKPSLATLAGNFRLPVLRDYLMSGGEGIWLTMKSRNLLNCICKVDLCPVVQLKRLLFTWICWLHWWIGL